MQKVFLFDFQNFRLNISGNVSRLDGSSIANTTFETSSQPSRKRPRYDPDDHPSVNTKLIEGINIIDDESSQPKFVKLINNAKQDVALHGWILKRKVGSQSYEFKFPKGMVLKAGATTTVRKTFFFSLI
jgi:hypothetical protein